MENFEMNGIVYQTDTETLNILREQVEAYRSGNEGKLDCIAVIMELGLKEGCIKEIKPGQEFLVATQLTGKGPGNGS